MTIIDFYKNLSELLKVAREKTISKADARFELQELLQKAEDYDLHVNIQENILDNDMLLRLDDERSYEETDFNSDSYSDSSDSSDYSPTSY